MWLSNGWMALVAIWTILAIVLGQQDILRNSSEYLEPQDILATLNINQVQEKSSSGAIYGEVEDVGNAREVPKENVKFRKMDSVRNSGLDINVKTEGNDSEKFAPETSKKDSYTLPNVPQGFDMVVNRGEYAKRKNYLSRESSDLKNLSINVDVDIVEIDSNKTVDEADEGDFIVIGKDVNFRKIQRGSSYVISRQEGYENLGKEITVSRRNTKYGNSENRKIDMEKREFNDAAEFERFYKNEKKRTRLNDASNVPVNEKIHTSQRSHLKFFEKSEDQISSKSTDKVVTDFVKDVKSMEDTDKPKEILDDSTDKIIEFDRTKNVESRKDYETNFESTTSGPDENLIPVSSGTGNTKSSWVMLSVGNIQNSTASSIPLDPKIHMQTVRLKSQFTTSNEIVREMENFSEQGSRREGALQSPRINNDKRIVANVTARLLKESLVDENNTEILSERKINIDGVAEEKKHVRKDMENKKVTQRIIDSYDTAENISMNDGSKVEQKEISVSAAKDSTRSQMNFRKTLFETKFRDKNETDQQAKIRSDVNLNRNRNYENVESSEEYDIARRNIIEKNTRIPETVNPYEKNSYLESSRNGGYPRNKIITNAHMKSHTGNAFSSVNPYGDGVLVENPLFKRSSNSKKYLSETTLPDKVVSDDKDVLSLGNAKASTTINVANDTFLTKMSGTSIFRKIQSISKVLGQKSDNRGLRETSWTDYSREIETTKYSTKNRKLTDRLHDVKGIISLIKKSINYTDNKGKHKASDKEIEASFRQHQNNNSENNNYSSLMSSSPAASNWTKTSLQFPRNILAKKYQGLENKMRRSNKLSQSVPMTSLKTSKTEKNFLYGTAKFNDHGTWIGSGPGTIIHDERSHELNFRNAISAAVNSKENEKTLTIGTELHETPAILKADVDDGKIKKNLEKNHVGTNSTRIPMVNKLDRPYGNAEKISGWVQENSPRIRSNDEENLFEENVTSSLTDGNKESSLVRRRVLDFIITKQTYSTDNNDRVPAKEVSDKDEKVTLDRNIYFNSTGKTLLDHDKHENKKIQNSRTSVPENAKSKTNYVTRTTGDDKDPFVSRNEFLEGTAIKEYKTMDTGCQTGSEQSLGTYYNINKSRLSATDSKNDEIGADGTPIKRTTRKPAITSDSPRGKIDENIILRKLSSDSVLETPVSSAFTDISKIFIKNDVSKKSNDTLISLGKSINEGNWLIKLMNDEKTSKYRGTKNSQNVSFDAFSSNLENFNRNNRNFSSPRKRNSLNLRETYENLDNGEEELGTPNSTIRSVIKSNDKGNDELNTSYETSWKKMYGDINNKDLKEQAIKNITILFKNENIASNIYGSTVSSYTEEWTESLNNIEIDSTTINILGTSIGILASNKDASLRSSDQDLYESLASNQSLSTYDQIESDNSTRVSSTLNQWPVKHSVVVEGDLVLGGLMMVHEREDSVTCGPVMPQGGVQALEAMLYTLDRLNEKGIVPGVKIGAHILDDCDKDTYGLEMAVDFIKGTTVATPDVVNTLLRRFRSLLKSFGCPGDWMEQLCSS